MTRADALAKLGLTEPLTAEVLRTRWHALALVHHPDKGGDASVFAELNAAHRFLEAAVLEAPISNCATCGGLGTIKRSRGFATVTLSCPDCQVTTEKT